jgi:hypothetical protein
VVVALLLAIWAIAGSSQHSGNAPDQGTKHAF